MADNNKLHALILGVSEYPNLPDPGQPDTPRALGMTKLTSPAISAFRVYEWLQKVNALGQLPLPLGHVSLLLSPSRAELQTLPELAQAKADGKFQECSLNNVLTAAAQWRNAAANDPNDMTWFYYSGHGVQRSTNDAILLLQDFGQAGGGILFNSIEVANVANGMTPSVKRPNIARSQVYFIDACRKYPERFKEIEEPNPTQVFDVDLGGRDDRKAPIIFSSISGQKSLGFDASESLFTRELLKSLNGSAADLIDDQDGNPRWLVTTGRLPEVLRLLFENDLFDQNFTVGGLRPGDVPLRKLAGPPEVDVLIDIKPELARMMARVKVLDVASLFEVHSEVGAPIVKRWPAGHYRFEVSIETPPYVSPNPAPRLILPPSHRYIGKVGQ